MALCRGEEREVRRSGQKQKRDGKKVQTLQWKDKLTFLDWPSASQLPQPLAEARGQKRNSPTPICWRPSPEKRRSRWFPGYSAPSLRARIISQLERAADKEGGGFHIPLIPLPHTMDIFHGRRGTLWSLPMLQSLPKRDLISARIQQRPAKMSGAVDSEACSAC